MVSNGDYSRPESNLLGWCQCKDLLIKQPYVHAKWGGVQSPSAATMCLANRILLTMTARSYGEFDAYYSSINRDHRWPAQPARNLEKNVL